MIFRGRSLERRGGRSAGFALIVVLLVVLLLETLVANITVYAWLSLQEARSFSRDAQHAAAVDGVLRVARSVLFQPDLTPDRLSAILHEGARNVQLGDATVDVRVEDENAKFNVNLLANSDPDVALDARREFSTLCIALGVGPTVAERVAHFISGGTPTPDTTPNPRPLTVLEELRNVQGMTDEMLFGDAAAPGPQANALANYLTCDGSGRLNVNTASRVALQAALSDVAPGLAELIVQTRGVSLLGSMKDIEGLMPLPPAALDRVHARLATGSEAYEVTVYSRAGESVQVSRGIIEKDPDGTGVIRICRRQR